MPKTPSRRPSATATLLIGKVLEGGGGEKAALEFWEQLQKTVFFISFADHIFISFADQFLDESINTK